MGKLLFLILLGIAIYLLLRQRPGAGGRSTGQQQEQRSAGTAEAMVSCAWCGLHVPLSESVEAGARHYCCEEHRRLDGGGHGN